ncbi:MAG: tetratricopeptide repeat protein [Bacteroidota bacterium]|jgi:tetratricopeptide (TPR) repeat protein
MVRQKKYFFILTLTLLIFITRSQDNTDSIKKNISISANDTNKIKSYNRLCRIYYNNGQTDSLTKYSKQAVQYTNLIFYNDSDSYSAKKWLAIVFIERAKAFKLSANYDSALMILNQSLENYKSIANEVGMAFVYNELGIVYKLQRNYGQAISYYLQSLSIREKLKDDKNIAGLLHNIGDVYFSIKDFKKAIAYIELALPVNIKTGNKNWLGFNYNSLGLIYKELGNYEKALVNYMKARNCFVEVEYREGIAGVEANMGDLYLFDHKYNKALESYKFFLSEMEASKNLEQLALANNNIAKTYVLLHNNKEAYLSFRKAIQFAKNLRQNDILRELYLRLSGLDSLNGDYKNAYINHYLYTAYSDSINTNENAKKVMETQMQYEYAKKHLADSLRVVQDKKINEFKFSKEKNQRYFLIAGILLIALFSLFMFSRYRLIKKQKHIIEIQKELVEQKQKEVIESLKYAKRIQQSWLPTIKYLERKIKNQPES